MPTYMKRCDGDALRCVPTEMLQWKMYLSYKDPTCNATDGDGHRKMLLWKYVCVPCLEYVPSTDDMCVPCLVCVYMLVLALLCIKCTSLE